MAIKKLTDRAFWRKTGRFARDMYKDIIFDGGKNVYGKKWKGKTKYSQFPSKWVMINILKKHRKAAPKEGYSYSQAKKGNMFRRQSSTKQTAVLSGNLQNDFDGYLKPRHNGVKLGYPTYGNVVEGLRDKFGDEATLTSEDKPLPDKVMKYITNEYHKFIKKNQKPTTRIHRIGK